MIRKYKKLVIFLLSIILTAAVSVCATLLFAGSRYLIAESEYEEYLNYKELEKNGFVLTMEQALYLDELARTYGGAYNVQKMIEENYYLDTTDIDFTLGAQKGIVEQLEDPYSYFLSADEFKELQDSMNSEYVGVGVVVSPTDDGYITVVSPFKDSPADRAGIKPLDKIIAINGEEVTGDQLQRAVELIRGKEGTEVTVRFKRDDIEFDIVLKREVIKVDTVNSEVIENNIGYISISHFGSETGDEFEEHLPKLTEDPKIKGLIIDLRFNPGGELDSLLQVADILLDDQVIITLKNKQGDIEEFRSDSENRYDGPIVVIVNEGSASASEALTGAIRDTGRCIVVGIKTFGKGVAQSLFPFSDGTALNLTTAEYFTPNGTNVNKEGITPDIIVEDDPDTPEDEQLDKAIETLKGLFT